MRKPLTPKRNEKRMAHMDEIMNEEAFNKMMGYPLDEVKRLADLLKEINDKRAVQNEDIPGDRIV